MLVDTDLLVFENNESKTRCIYSLFFTMKPTSKMPYYNKYANIDVIMKQNGNIFTSTLHNIQ